MSAPDPSLFGQIDEAAEERALAEAERVIAEGRVVSHDAVRRCNSSSP